MHVSRIFSHDQGRFYCDAHSYFDQEIGARTMVHDTLDHLPELRCKHEQQEEFRALGALANRIRRVFPDDIERVVEEGGRFHEEKQIKEKYPGLTDELLSLVGTTPVPIFAFDSMVLGFVTARHRFGDEVCELTRYELAKIDRDLKRVSAPYIRFSMDYHTMGYSIKELW